MGDKDDIKEGEEPGLDDVAASLEEETPGADDAADASDKLRDDDADNASSETS